MNDMNDSKSQHASADASQIVFVSGGSGYIGGRLVPRLLEAGYRVRCLARNPRKLEARTWARHPNVEIVAGDVGDRDGLTELLRGCGAAYYLVHSMLAAGADYAEQDRELAENFAAAAEKAGVERILYLGGLGETGRDLSEHLSSRREVEHALASDSSAGHRAARRHDHRLGIGLVRDPALSGRAAARDDHAAVGRNREPADRGTQCPPLPDAMPGDPETIGRTLDIGGAEILSYREIMASWRKSWACRATGHTRPGAHAPAELPVDPSRHAAQRQHRASAGRRTAQSGRLPRRRGRTADATERY